MADYKILVPLDGSRTAEHALVYLQAFKRLGDCKVRLLAVADETEDFHHEHADEALDRESNLLATYLREEVQQEGLARNIGAFSRFLEAASFSQGSVLNMTAVARECAVSVKVVEDYFSILEDLLIAVRLPVFSRRAKRRMVAHPKFYYFDAGVFQTIRPRGPLDGLSRAN